MGSDYHYRESTGIDEVTGYPKDRWGHLLNRHDSNEDGEYLELTSPYGSLYFAIGSDDDFICFDWNHITT
ncbi:MAG: hypothetical protein ACTSWQ_04000, partial [Candidatus Thorarchaeota archaeon]